MTSTKEIKTRQYTSFTDDLFMDLKYLHGIDGEAELMNILEIELEHHLSSLPERPVVVDKFLTTAVKNLVNNTIEYHISYSYYE